MSKPMTAKEKGAGCAIVLVAIGAIIGTNCTFRGGPKSVPVSEPEPVIVKPVKPASKPAPQPEAKPQPAPPKPINPRTTPTAELLKIFSAWQHDDSPRTPEIQCIYEELLHRPEVEWHNNIGSIRPEGWSDDYGGKRRRRR